MRCATHQRYFRFLSIHISNSKPYWRKTMSKITVKGIVMWENEIGERLKEPDEEPDICGWHAVTVNGRRMWESPEGERVFR